MENKELLKGWSYEFGYWMSGFGSAPIRLVKSEDYSPPYEMSRGHVFELENGKFAFVTEEGCSCYDASQANIELFPNEQSAVDAFSKWESSAKRSSY